jgi:hypothetical protein
MSKKSTPEFNKLNSKGLEDWKESKRKTKNFMKISSTIHMTTAPNSNQILIKTIISKVRSPFLPKIGKANNKSFRHPAMTFVVFPTQLKISERVDTTIAEIWKFRPSSKSKSMKFHQSDFPTTKQSLSASKQILSEKSCRHWNSKAKTKPGDSKNIQFFAFIFNLCV